MQPCEMPLLYVLTNLVSTLSKLPLFTLWQNPLQHGESHVIHGNAILAPSNGEGEVGRAHFDVGNNSPLVM